MGACTLLAGAVLVYFPEALRGGAVPQHRLGADGSQTFYSVLSTGQGSELSRASVGEVALMASFEARLAAAFNKVGDRLMSFR